MGKETVQSIVQSLPPFKCSSHRILPFTQSIVQSQLPFTLFKLTLLKLTGRYYEKSAVLLLWAVLINFMPHYLGVEGTLISLVFHSLAAWLLGSSIGNLIVIVGDVTGNNQLQQGLGYLFGSSVLLFLGLNLLLHSVLGEGFGNILALLLIGTSGATFIHATGDVIRAIKANPKKQHTAEEKAASRKKNAGLVLGAVIGILSLLSAIFQVIPSFLRLFNK